MRLVLLACGAVATAIGTWQSYAMARAALAPFVHDGDPTRTLIESTRPVTARPRVRLFARRVGLSLAWLAVALYGLLLAVTGLEPVP